MYNIGAPVIILIHRAAVLMRGAIDNGVIFIALGVRISRVLAQAVALVHLDELIIVKLALKGIKGCGYKLCVKAGKAAVFIRVKERLNLFGIGNQHGGVRDRIGIAALR